MMAQRSISRKKVVRDIRSATANIGVVNLQNAHALPLSFDTEAVAHGFRGFADRLVWVGSKSAC
jgi:hypothetical protein